MSLAWKRVSVYLRVILVVLVVGAIGLVLFQNRNHRVHLWFFGIVDETREVNVVWVILWTALITRIVWFVLSFSLRLWRDMREVRKQETLEQAKKDQQQREAELVERERRLNEQITHTDEGGAAQAPRNPGK